MANNTLPQKIADAMEASFAKAVLADDVEVTLVQYDDSFTISARVAGSMVFRLDVTHWLKNAFGIVLQDDDISISKDQTSGDAIVSFSLPC